MNWETDVWEHLVLAGIQVVYEIAAIDEGSGTQKWNFEIITQK